MADIYGLERLINRWYERSTDAIFPVDDPFDKFVCLWIAFNAWGSHVTNLDIDRRVIDTLKKDRRLREAFGECIKRPHFLNELRTMKGVQIPSHRRNQPPVAVRDENSVEELLEVVYKIRCNLFHGRKDPQAVHDAGFVRWAHSVLGAIFDELRHRPDFMLLQPM
jgi:hypothetical protein